MRPQNTQQLGSTKTWLSLTKMIGSKYQFYVRKPWTRRCRMAFLRARNQESAF